MNYSVEFKKAAVQKYLTRGNRKVSEISDSLGITVATLYHWCNKFAKVDGMKKPTQPQSRSTLEKIKSIAEYNSLAVEKRGEYLRKNGLYEENILEWQNQVEEAFSPIKKSLVDRKELLEEKEKNKQLEIELNQKEKALAEVAALLVLKKKADLIWGKKEEK